jgi:hypothetical protein
LTKIVPFDPRPGNPKRAPQQIVKRRWSTRLKLRCRGLIAAEIGRRVRFAQKARGCAIFGRNSPEKYGLSAQFATDIQELLPPLPADRLGIEIPKLDEGLLDRLAR